MKKKMVLTFVTAMMTVAVSMAVNKGMAEADGWEHAQQVEALIHAPQFKSHTYNICDYHHAGDSLYTDAINQAIVKCSNDGGGTVLIPDGDWYTGPIRLRSHVNLHLSDHATLHFITDATKFPVVLTRIEGIDCYNISPLIYAYGEQDIAITGKGVIDGQATEENWLYEGHRKVMVDGKLVGEKDELAQMLKAQTPVKERQFAGKHGMRPQTINLYACKNILLEDFTIHRAPFWQIHPLLSENITMRRVTMESHGHNNDGCDPESCKDMLMDDCTFDTGDDCIAIKSGKNEDGRRWMRPSENIIIRNCKMRDGHAGVAIGSEITGCCRNVWVENCEMDSPNLQRIIRIKSNKERGGEVSYVYVRNLKVGECALAILGLELNYGRISTGAYKPSFHDIYLSNISSKKSKYVVSIIGFPNELMAHHIYFNHCIFDGVTSQDINDLRGAVDVKFHQVTVNGKSYN
jgi:polygalacturonase